MPRQSPTVPIDIYHRYLCHSYITILGHRRRASPIILSHRRDSTGQYCSAETVIDREARAVSPISRAANEVFNIARQRRVSSICTGDSSPSSLPQSNRQTARRNGEPFLLASSRLGRDPRYGSVVLRFSQSFLGAYRRKPTSIERGEGVGFGLSRQRRASGRLQMEHREKSSVRRDEHSRETSCHNYE